MNVTVIAPHPDDEVLGCGGTIYLRACRGDRVTVVFLTSGEHGMKSLPRDEAWRIRESEAAAAAAVLKIEGVTFLRQRDYGLEAEAAGAAVALAPILQREQPDIVYLPHELDGHPDHTISVAIVRAALHDYSGALPALLTYETWSPLSSFDHVEDISSVMAVKLRALRCHASQIGHFRYDRAVRGLNSYRGELAARCRYAEVFNTVDAHMPGRENRAMTPPL
jgi:LmbE family N-acetylglucosaminyl deacetylase